MRCRSSHRSWARTLCRLLALFCGLATLTLSARPVWAVEEYQKFLASLREREYFDLALDYLERMQSSPLITEEQRYEIPYEEGMTLLEASKAEHDLVARGKYLEKARQKLEKFIAEHAEHALAASAGTQLGGILIERGRILLVQSKSPSKAAKKDELVAEARKLFQQAQGVFEEAEKKFAERSKSFPKFIDPKDVERIEARDRTRSDLIQARLFSAAVIFEIAKTYPEGSAEANQNLQVAADKYEKVYEQFRRRFAGIYARLKQGNCYQEMGDAKRALGYYGEVQVQPDEAGLRDLKATAMHLTLQCLTSDKEKKFDEALQRGQEWLNAAVANEDRKKDGLGIHYFTALAGMHVAQELPANENVRKNQMLRQARTHAGIVAKIPGDYREAAQALFRKLSGIEDDGEEKAAETFADARDRGKEALEVWQGRLALIKGAKASDDEANIPKYEQDAAAAREKAEYNLALALNLRDESTTMDDLNGVRYLLCFMYYQEGRSYDAAVLGEFLATKYPESAGARSAAKIALAAYVDGYQASKPDARDFDRRKMGEIAEFITKRWPGEAEADEAWTVLMSIAVNERELPKAVEYLGKIPLESPRRGAAELKTGQAIWAEYLKSARLEETERPAKADLDKLIQQSRETLESGVQRMRAAVDAGAEVDTTLAAAALSLAQIYVELDQAAKAVEILADPKIGPMTLVHQKHAAVQGNYAVEAYKISLRANVGIQKLEDAQLLMDELEQLVGASGDENANSILTKIYISLGRSLEDQLKRLQQANQADAAQKVAQAFELFLDKIAARGSKGNTFSTLNWVAATFYSLGSGFDPGGDTVLDQAKAYYEKAVTTDQQIVELAKAAANFASPESLLSVRLRMARCLRRTGKFQEAVELVVTILQEKEALLDAQKEVAYAFMDWARQDHKQYSLAIKGDRPYKNKRGQLENLVWGWAKMAVKVQKDPKHDATFHEARYNLAKCRWLQGIKTSDETEQKDLFKKSKADLLLTFQLRSEMGGPEMFRKSETLLKNIQKSLGEPTTGFPKVPATTTAGVTPNAAAGATGTNGATANGKP